MKFYKCPRCGEVNNLHFNYDLTKQHRPVIDVLCNMCGEFFDGDMPVAELIDKHTEGKGFSAYLRTIEQIQEEMVEVVARREFEKVGDEGLFPNHTDMDIWVSGFVAAVNYIKDATNKLI